MEVNAQSIANRKMAEAGYDAVLDRALKKIYRDEEHTMRTLDVSPPIMMPFSMQAWVRTVTRSYCKGKEAIWQR